MPARPETNLNQWEKVASTIDMITVEERICDLNLGTDVPEVQTMNRYMMTVGERICDLNLGTDVPEVLYKP